MIITIKDNDILSASTAQQIHVDSVNKVLAFEKNNLLFIFNFSPNNSIFDYRFWAPKKGSYRIILNSDKKEFGGFDRIDDTIAYPTDKNQQLSIYLTNRTTVVMKME